MSKSAAVNEPSAPAKSSIPSPQNRTRDLAGGWTIVAMGAACLVYLAVAMTYLTSLAGVNTGGSMILRGDIHAGDVAAVLPGATIVPSLWAHHTRRVPNPNGSITYAR
jgi:hypothetical protein